MPSLKNEQNVREISEYKMLICKKTVGLRSGKFSDLNSACLEEVVYVIMKVNGIGTEQMSYIMLLFINCTGYTVNLQ